MAPICVIVGVVLLWYLILLRRNRIQQIRRSDAAILSEWAVMFVLVAMSLFWIATDYSVAVGQTPPSSESAYHFRYHGLVLLIEIGGRYVSGASGLERGQGTAIVLPKDAGGAMRLEFATSDDYQPSPTC